MVYRKYHYERNDQCENEECTSLNAYVRIEGRWTRIGYYGSECKQFNQLDLKQEEKDRKLKQRVRDLTKLVRNAKNMTLEQVDEQIKHFNNSKE